MIRLPHDLIRLRSDYFVIRFVHDGLMIRLHDPVLLMISPMIQFVYDLIRL